MTDVFDDADDILKSGGAGRLDLARIRRVAEYVAAQRPREPLQLDRGDQVARVAIEQVLYVLSKLIDETGLRRVLAQNGCLGEVQTALQPLTMAVYACDQGHEEIDGDGDFCRTCESEMYLVRWEGEE